MLKSARCLAVRAPLWSMASVVQRALVSVEVLAGVCVHFETKVPARAECIRTQYFIPASLPLVPPPSDRVLKA